MPRFLWRSGLHNCCPQSGQSPAALGGFSTPFRMRNMECGSRLRYVWHRAGRQKQVGETDTHTSLRRCLSTLQMTAIGLGSTVGVGIYVLLGVAIRDYAGPAVVLSFLVAGLVVLSNAVIFAEFGSYIPHTGAAYTYMYKAIGELAAFLAGWMGLFSLTSSAATGARAWSGFVDSLFNHSIQAYFDDKVGQLNMGPPFARSLDWMGFVFFLVLTLVVSFNVQCSSLINTILAVLTNGVLIFVAIAGFVVGDLSRLVDKDLGGFMPYGVGGVVTGASAAFFAFNGFDSICISAEEAKDPVKSVPRAIMIELLIVTVVYCGAAVGTVSLIPFKEIDLRAPIPSAFAYQGMTWARIIVTIGPVIAMTNLSLMSLYAQSRIFYRMAQDGLLFQSFSYIHPRTKVPLLGVVVCGVLVAVSSLLLELEDLVQFAVLCMLFQYIILAPALINLRCLDMAKSSPSSLSTSTSTHPHPHHLHMSPTPSQESLSQQGRSHDREPLLAESQLSSMYTHRRGGGVEGSDSLVDDVAPGGTSSASSINTFSYVRDGDLGFGDGSEGDDLYLTPRTPTSGISDLSINNNHASDSSPQQQQLLLDIGGKGGAEFSEFSEDGSVHSLFRNRNVDPNSSELADESHFSEESSHQHQHQHQQLRTGESSLLGGPDGARRVFDGKHTSGFDFTIREFFRLLTTRRCLMLLVILLFTLALQLGLAWQDLRDMKMVGVVSVTVIVAVVIFLCEVLRKRCGPGMHEGFKVPFMPYLPVLSCFLNMLLLVTASDYRGILQFSVLMAAGLVVYVIMVMRQWTEDDARSSSSLSLSSSLLSVQQRSMERRGLLLPEDNDADSEGSM